MLRKYTFCFSLFAALFFAACTSGDTAPRRAILDYLASEAPTVGFRYRVLSLDIRPFTVADSLATLDEWFADRRDRQIASQQKTLDYLRSIAPAPGPGYAVLKKANDEVIEAALQRIAALRAAAPAHHARFEGRDPAEVLCLCGECTYRQTYPGSDRASETFATFLLTPDGSRVTGKAANPDPADS